MEGKKYIVGTGLLVGGFLLVVPYATYWALNTIASYACERTVSIPYGFETILAFWILYALFRTRPSVIGTKTVTAKSRRK